MKYSRYKFLKERNKRSVVLLLSKGNKYVSFKRDNRILKYIGFSNNLNVLEDCNINYIVLDNLDVIVDRRFSNNNYMKYLKLSYFELNPKNWTVYK